MQVKCSNRVRSLIFVCFYLLHAQTEEEEPSKLLHLPCTDADRDIEFQILFPLQGARLDVETDLGMMRNLLVRTRVSSHGNFRNSSLKVRFIVAVAESATAAVDTTVIGTAAQPNFEVFGMSDGTYYLAAKLVDEAGMSRECWNLEKVRFSVGEGGDGPRAPEDVLVRGLNKMFQEGGRSMEQQTPWLMQPKGGGDFAYVTAIWSDNFVDCVLAWATSLIMVGSTFRRICMIAQGRVSEAMIQALRNCCCEILIVDLIAPPKMAAAKKEWSRYELVLTKFRVFQLHKMGLRKIVLMDSDTLVLENIDELFWFPAPAATLTKGALLGETRDPELSAGVMVLETSEAEFDGILRFTREWEDANGESDALLFAEQQLLSKYWFKDGRPTYYILPLTYNLYPELLDTFPYLRKRIDSKRKDRDTSGTTVKVVHFWDWFNPILGGARKNMQIEAKLKSKHMWEWYELWWEMHQRGIRKAIGDVSYFAMLKICQENMRAIGHHEDQIAMVRPILDTGSMQRRHIYGLTW